MKYKNGRNVIYVPKILNPIFVAYRDENTFRVIVQRKKNIKHKYFLGTYKTPLLSIIEIV